MTTEPRLPNRTKAFKSKVSTGCKTCKIRRIKCDEVKPHCRRCTSTGRKCDGYSPVPASRNSIPPKSEASASSSISIRSCAAVLDKILHAQGINLLLTPQELRSFTSFRTYTVRQIGSIFDAEFWNRLLLQAAYHEPAIRHAICALGALHEVFEKGHPGTKLLETGEGIDQKTVGSDDSLALQQYVKALGYFLEPMKETGKQLEYEKKEDRGIEKHMGQKADVALMTCILFICFETLRGHHGAALSHIEGGVKILAELQESADPSRAFWPSTPSKLTRSPTPYIPLSTFNVIFIRLDTQASSISAPRDRQLLSPTLDFGLSGYGQDIPPCFSTLEQASNSLYSIQTSSFRTAQGLALFMNSDEGWVAGNKETRGIEAFKVYTTLALMRQEARASMAQWNTAFDAYMKENKDNGMWDEVAEERIEMLKLHAQLQISNFEVDLVKGMVDQTVWDEFLPSFVRVVDDAEKIVHKNMAKERSSPTACAHNGGKKSKIFGLEAGIIFPVYFVAIKCRDHPTRRRAIALLRAQERQEGVWNSILTARVAERLVEIEESGLSPGDERGYLTMEEIPRENRVAGVEVRFELQEKRAWLRYQRMRHIDGEKTVTGMGELQGVVVEDEWVEW